MTPDEARDHLLAWTRARSDREAAAELSEAMIDDADPALWALGLEALAMLNPAVAVPAVRRLRSHNELGAPGHRLAPSPYQPGPAPTTSDSGAPRRVSGVARICPLTSAVSIPEQHGPDRPLPPALGVD